MFNTFSPQCDRSYIESGGEGDHVLVNMYRNQQKATDAGGGQGGRRGSGQTTRRNNATTAGSCITTGLAL